MSVIDLSTLSNPRKSDQLMELEKAVLDQMNWIQILMKSQEVLVIRMAEIEKELAVLKGGQDDRGSDNNLKQDQA